MSRRVALVLALGVTACGKGADWSTYHAQDGRFSVAVPAKPVEETKPQIPSPVTTVLVDRHAAGMFQVAHFAMPILVGMDDDTIDAALKLDCLAPFDGGSFVAGTPTPRPLGKHRGLAITGRAPRSDALPAGGFEEDRCYAVGDHFYHLIGVAPDTAAGRADVARFLDSFALAAR